MDSARSFVRLWLCLTAGVLVYAWLDLRVNPRLLWETQVSMRPNWSQLPDLMHWGGRLLNHGAHGLLVANALLLSGMGALLIRGVWRLIRRKASERDEHVSIVPVSPPTSVPPPSFGRRDSHSHP